MHRFRWLRPFGVPAADEFALERYFRIEGLHAELESHLLRAGISDSSSSETLLYAARSYFVA